MGYCGIPSRACSNCRARRIKCNLSHPCSQCLRAGHPCDGAREIMDLMFRDQSKEVACKAQGIKHKAKPKGSASVGDTGPGCCQVPLRSIDSDVSAASDSLNTWWRTLQVPAEQQAVCFFFSNYVLEPSDQSRSVYDFLPGFYNNESERSSMSCAVAALGLAGLSYRRSEPCLLDAAKSMYSSALHLTNEALRNPATAQADATLISVLLLGLYEINTCNAPPSMRAWLKHISGARALLELRGKQQLDTEIGRRLFVHVRAQIAIFCILRRQPIPTTILELSDMLSTMSEDKEIDPATKIIAINAQLCDLKAKIASIPSGSAVESVGSNISEALSIAANLNSWHSELSPDHFPTSTVKIYSPTPEVYSDYYHIYQDQWTATLLNNYRVILILVHEIILTQLSTIGYASPEWINGQSSHPHNSSPSYYVAQIERQIKSSQTTILDVIDLICASVPFLLGHGYGGARSPAPSESPRPRAAGGNAVMWPLYVAAQIPFVHNATRAWLIGRLEKIGAEMGVQQAAIMSKFLLQRKEVTDVLVDDSDAHDDDAIT